MRCLNRTRTLFWSLSCALMAAGAAHAQTTWRADVTDAPGESATRDEMPDGLRRAVAAALEEDAHAIRAPAEHDSTSGYEAVNRKNGLRFSFDRGGVRIAPRGDGRAPWSARMTLAGIGYEGDVRALPGDAAPQVRIDGNRIEYRHQVGLGRDQGPDVSVVEWYINDRRGLEQGFTLAGRPARSGVSPAPLCLDLAVSGDLTPVLAGWGSYIRFLDDSGSTALRYGHLTVFDARGHDLPARLRAAPGSLTIVVDDRAAEYPLTIDPLFEVAKLTASDAAAGDYFGYSVSISGDTAIVGAYGNDDAGSASGSAYIFRRDQGGADNWGQVRKLTASDAAAYDLFGYSVSISGDTAIVGAVWGDSAVSDSGSAYIFRRDWGGADNWGQVAKLTASDAAAEDWFGYSVSISGDTAIVGARYGDSAVGNSGSAYIFRRDQGGADNWGQVKKLTASDAAAGDYFGYSVSISGDTAIVGAYGNDDAGYGSGSAYIFRRDQGGADNWGQVKKLTASDAAAYDLFGYSVSISGDTAIVGAVYGDSAVADSGSAYIFRRDQGGADNWGQVKKLTASDAAAGDRFGYSVSISGDTAIVGADWGDSAVTDSGSAYIFRRDQGGADNWGEVKKLTASDAAAGDQFGRSVSISGDTAIVGADWGDSAVTDSGSAYIFTGTVHNVTQNTWHITIQSAIDGAFAGDQIAVPPGTYQEAINFLGEAITLRSTDGPEVTIIDASGLGASVVTCVNGEGPDTVLEGFTITGGWATYGGGMYNAGSSPTVTNCTFTANSATGKGGGMCNTANSAPRITNCTFSGNSATFDGGGLYNYISSPTVTNCTFSGNTGEDGAGMRNWQSSPTVTNCTFAGNTATHDGGGMNNYWHSGPRVTNCRFSGNSADPTDGHGGGMFTSGRCYPTVANCTFSGNSAANGQGIACDSVDQQYPSSVSMTNCILWDAGNEIWNNDGSTITVTYSDVQDDDPDDGIAYPGTGNIDDDPLFLSPGGGDLHLLSRSPCIDAGDNTAVSEATDLDGHIRIVDGDGDATATVDMGAYEFGSIPDDCNENGIPDMCDLDCAALGGDCNVPDCGLSSDGDADGYPDECETVHNVTQGTWHPWIQLAINSAVGGDEIVAGPRTYREAIDFLGLGITLRSTDGPEVTIIDASGLGASVVTCVNGEGPDTVLEGFTITGGSAGYGGGICNEGSSPTVTDCTFTGNTAVKGGGMSNRLFSTPTITKCTFSGNTAAGGGGMYNYSSHPTVTNCTFSGNSADYGGGMRNWQSSPTVTNCTFTGNTASNDGGGINNYLTSNPTLTNCTFTGNTGTNAGGGMYNLQNSSPTVTNCILWGDTASNGPEIYNDSSSPTVTYSDVQGGYSGEGNIDADPLFVDDVNGDVRLGCASPCVDAGDNNAVPVGVTTDLTGNPRFVDDAGVDDTGAGAPPIVDMGAYERQDTSEPSSPTNYYVGDNTCPDTGAGTEGDPFCRIQTAINVACDGDEIVVLPGTYNEAIDFHGKAVTLGSSHGADMTTIDATGLGTRVVTCVSGEGLDTVLEGFTITGGNAQHGGGMGNYGSSPTVMKCTFSANSASRGAGMYNLFSSPTVTNCTFSGNSAAYDGGGMTNEWYSSPAVTNCTFSGNTATAHGGGMFNYDDSSPTVTNCTFSGNSVGTAGGGMFNSGSSPRVTNCILWGDTGGEIYNDGSTPVVTYSDVEGGYTGMGNIDDDPLFMDPDGPDDIVGNQDDNLRLWGGSPCIDAALDSAVTVPTDLDGNPRVVDGDNDGTATVDMGAYEYADCNDNDIPDQCDLYCDAFGGACNVPDCGLSSDNDDNGVPDECECPELAAPATPAGEAGYEKVRYISLVPGNAGYQTALRVTLTTLPAPFDGFNDTKCWVGEPQQVSENSGKINHEPGWPDFMSANLDGDPYCMDWSTVEVLHVTDDDIIPGAVYDVQAIECDCDFENEANYSAPLTITTSKWGDLVGTCAVIPCSPPEGVVNMATDVTACLDKFRNLAGAVMKSRADIEPNFPDWLVNIADVTYVLDAFRGFAYPAAQTPPAPGWPGPDGCP